MYKTYGNVGKLFANVSSFPVIMNEVSLTIITCICPLTKALIITDYHYIYNLSPDLPHNHPMLVVPVFSILLIIHCNLRLRSFFSEKSVWYPY